MFMFVLEYEIWLIIFHSRYLPKYYLDEKWKAMPRIKNSNYLSLDITFIILAPKS